MPERRIESLDVVRGLAAFAIVLFHVRVPLWLGWHEIAGNPQYSGIDRAMAWASLPLAMCGSAVMLFFVISGFAIHYPYAPSARPNLELRSYGIRRLLRLYPPYAAAILITVVAERISVMLTGAELSTLGQIANSLAMAQNYLYPGGQLFGNPSLWSLPVEAELYLAYPLLYWLWRRTGLGAAFMFVVLLSLSAAGPLLFGYEWPQGNFAKYWVIWASGAVLADWSRANSLPRWRMSFWFLIGAGVALGSGSRVIGLPVGFDHFVWGAVYFLLVLWVLTHPSRFTRIPGHARGALLWLGRISYSLYLVHFPTLLVLGACWIWAFGTKPSNLLVPLAASLLTLPPAYLLWRFVERPSQRWGQVLANAARRPAARPVSVQPAELA